MRRDFGGVTTALVTPFKNGDVDYHSLKRLLTHQLDHGIQGFVVAGTTGEAATMSLEEKDRVLQFVISEVAGQVPVIMGSGTFNTRETAELCARFERFKPDGFLIVTPYYNKPPQRGLERHFLAVAAATKLPIILYNVPGRTSCTMLPETVAAVAKKASNVVAVKEAAGNLDVIKELRRVCGPAFGVLSGDDATFVPAMGLGAQGVISVISHVIPGWCVNAAQEAAKNKNVEQLNAEVSEVANLMFCESNPIPLKWCLKEMGIIDSDELRLPLVELDPQFHSPLRQALAKMGAL